MTQPQRSAVTGFIRLDQAVTFRIVDIIRHKIIGDEAIVEVQIGDLEPQVCKLKAHDGYTASFKLNIDAMKWIDE